MADDIMTIPMTDELISPLLSVIPLQLFACYLGMAKGFDVDKPQKSGEKCNRRIKQHESDNKNTASQTRLRFYSRRISA